MQIQIAPKLIKENEPLAWPHPVNQEIFHLMQKEESDVLSQLGQSASLTVFTLFTLLGQDSEFSRVSSVFVLQRPVKVSSLLKSL